MWKQVLMILMSVSLLTLGSCQAGFKLWVGDRSLEGTVGITPFPASDDATSLGRGTCTLDKTGDTFEGEFFDTDGDGEPDKFKPDKGQGSKRYNGGETNGTDWHEVKVE